MFYGTWCFVAIVVLGSVGVPISENVSKHVSFVLPYLQDCLHLLAYMAGIFGTLRVIGAAGLLKDSNVGICAVAY